MHRDIWKWRNIVLTAGISNVPMPSISPLRSNFLSPSSTSSDPPEDETSEILLVFRAGEPHISGLMVSDFGGTLVFVLQPSQRPLEIPFIFTSGIAHLFDWLFAVPFDMHSDICFIIGHFGPSLFICAVISCIPSVVVPCVSKLGNCVRPFNGQLEDFVLEPGLAEQFAEFAPDMFYGVKSSPCNNG